MNEREYVHYAKHEQEIGFGVQSAESRVAL